MYSGIIAFAMDYTEDEVKEMAKQLKVLFAARKEEKDKRKYTPHKRFDTKKCWYDTAEVVLRLGANPIDYIEAQFAFAKSTVFANTLHTETAKSRYRRFIVVKQKKEGIEKISFKANPAPREAELATLIADEIKMMDFRYGGHDLTKSEVSDKVLHMRISHDPLVMMLLNPTKRFTEAFGKAAKERLQEFPYLRKAAAELGFELALELIDES